MLCSSSIQTCLVLLHWSPTSRAERVSLLCRCRRNDSCGTDTWAAPGRKRTHRALIAAHLIYVLLPPSIVDAWCCTGVPQYCCTYMSSLNLNATGFEPGKRLEGWEMHSLIDLHLFKAVSRCAHV
uniref:Putative secreted protein n=1 Tax=Ixodes ricinus TaxID=34613 RepID=A0A6B0UPF9_IXORI